MTLCDIYHIRCHPNAFIYTGYDFKEKTWATFIIDDKRNDLKDFIEYLNDIKVQIGYNNIEYDYPIIHYLIQMRDIFLKTGSRFICDKLHQHKEKLKEQEYSSVPQNEVYIKQVDLLKVWHLGNKKKRTSFTDLKIALLEEDCTDFPIPENLPVNDNNIEDAVNYNINDVSAIYDFYNLSLGNTENPLFKDKNKITLRSLISKEYGINCLNYSNVMMGQTIVLSVYSKVTNKSYSEVKKMMGSSPDYIDLKTCIPSFAEFKTKEMNSVLDKLKSTTIDKSGKFENSIYFNNLVLDYGLGGLHGCVRPGIYRSDGNDVIIDEDVTSFFPSMVVGLELYPKHLGQKFLEAYSKIVSRRREEKRKENGDPNIIESLKYGSNSIIGKSNEEGTVFYDPQFFYSVTIGGQILMSMWIEKLVLEIPDIKILQVNTDGLTYIINRKYIDKAKEIKEYIEHLVDLRIETEEYDRIIIKDISNYIAVYSDHSELDPHYKLRGCFEIFKEIWLDHSMPIVAEALKNYFIYGVPVNQTVRSCNDILAFCIRARATKKYEICRSKYDSSGEHFESLQKSNRLYVSTEGDWIVKKEYDSDKVEPIVNGKYLTVFNKYEEKDKILEYNIDYSYYILEARKIIDTIKNNQLYLFE